MIISYKNCIFKIQQYQQREEITQYMKRYLIILIIALVYPCSSLWAQSMTDAQVIEFVQKEQKAGTSQSQIVTKLMQKGVDVNQLRRLKKMYDNKSSNGSSGLLKDEAMADSKSRMRRNNGDPKEKMRRNSSTSQQLREERLYDRTYDSNDEDFMLMSREFNSLYPDSLQLEDEEYLEYLQSKKKPKVFGRDIFNKKNLTFEPAMNIATPQNYRLGPGDAVYIDVFGGTQKTIEDTISPDGTVTIEGYGPVYISGLTVDQATAKLRSTVGSRYSSSSIKLTVGQTRTIMVNVMGEVKAPGSYTLSAFATVFHALYMAGGVSDIGTLRNIQVYRQGRLVTSVDVYDFILNGKLTGNVRLADNDVILVGAYDCLVNIQGKVKRPMIYEMKKNESMQSLLKYAGGFANDAYKNSVRVVRKTGRQYSVYNVTEFDMASFHVNDGDSVTVDSILNRYENTVEIKGAIFRPGLYQLGGEITTVKNLLENAEGPTEDAFLTHAVMHRMKKDRTLEILSVDLEGILEGRVADIPLRNEDVLFVPTQQRAMEEQTITIHGEVQYPGIYKYASNETLEDFVLQAGGLTESASVMKVDISRRVINPKAVTTDSLITKNYTFALKEGFVIDGEQGFKLEPFDEVYVRRSPSYTKQQNVSIEGYVLFPGSYAIGKKNTRLSDLIASAGGINDQGYAEGARLERRITDNERKRMTQLIKMQLDAQNSYLDKENQLDSITMAERLNIGETISVGIDLKAAIENPGSDDDIVLREGDKITVPQYDGTVRVSGEVMYANTMAFEKGKNARYYIRQAGGYSLKAKKSHAYIIYANGKVDKVSKGAKVQPGCEIVVPLKPTRKDSLQKAQAVTSMASVLATVAAVVISATR